MSSETMKGNERKEESSYHSKLEKWTSKELQLNVLHEEIINKREAMLRTSRNFLFGKGAQQPLISNTDAAIRNDKLVKDMRQLDEDISHFLTKPQTPRMSNLEANYWSMVKNMFPIWQRSVEEVEKKQAAAS